MRPKLTDYPSFYKGYVTLAKGKDMFEAMEASQAYMKEVLTDDFAVDYAYAKGKWTVGQLLVHIQDAERIMAYRALRFARFDKTELAGYDHDVYVDNMAPITNSLEELIQQQDHLRASTVDLFKQVEPFFNNYGTANQGICNVNALGFIIAGHQIHHLNILAERYVK